MTKPTEIMCPTLGRIVIFTSNEGDEYPGMVTGVHDNDDDDENVQPTVIDLVTFGPLSTYHHQRVRFHVDGNPRTWRWPSHSSRTFTLS